jgi:microcystin-dependent protein
MFGGNFAPQGWAFCDGAILEIAQHESLFELIGTTYGGDGQETFALPDLRGRVPVHRGQGAGLTHNYLVGEKGGVEQVALTLQQTPAHNHTFMGTWNLATNTNPNSLVVAQTKNFDLYLEDDPTFTMASNALSSVGDSQPHNNVQSSLVINFIISLSGIFPEQA